MNQVLDTVPCLSVQSALNRSTGALRGADDVRGVRVPDRAVGAIAGSFLGTGGQYLTACWARWHKPLLWAGVNALDLLTTLVAYHRSPDGSRLREANPRAARLLYRFGAKGLVGYKVAATVLFGLALRARGWPRFRYCVGVLGGVVVWNCLQLAVERWVLPADESTEEGG